jgi:hypothetical protein
MKRMEKLKRWMKRMERMERMKRWVKRWKEWKYGWKDGRKGHLSETESGWDDGFVGGDGPADGRRVHVDLDVEVVRVELKQISIKSLIRFFSF